MKKSPTIYQRSIDGTYQQKVQEEKLIAISILNSLKYTDPSVLLAGGAIRDWRLGENIRDLDFYFKAPNHRTESLLKTLLQDIGVGSVERLEECGEYEALPHIKSVWEGDYRGVKCNFIILEDNFKLHYTHYFSNSLSGCWMKSDGITCYSEDFEKSVVNNTIYLYRNHTESSPHIQKVRTKYPKWEVKHKSYWKWEE